MSQPTIALALGGGGARGIAHVHVLEALDKLGVRPSVIAGTSIGSIVGAGYASGMTGAEIKEHFLSTFADRLQVMRKIWALGGPKSMRTVFAESLTRFGEMNAEKVLEALLPEKIPATFEDLRIPLNVTAVEFYSGEEIHIGKGPLHKALAASAAIPVIFKPVMHQGRILYDGGLVNPCPFDLVHGKADIILAVDVVGKPEGDDTTLPSRTEAGFGGSQLMMQTINKLKLRDYKPDIFITPPVNKVRVGDFWKVSQILEQTAPAYEETVRKLEAVLEKAA